MPGLAQTRSRGRPDRLLPVLLLASLWACSPDVARRSDDPAGGPSPTATSRHGLLAPPRDLPTLAPAPPGAPELALRPEAETLTSGRTFHLLWVGSDVWAATLRGVEILRPGEGGLASLSHQALPGHTRYLEPLGEARMLVCVK